MAVYCVSFRFFFFKQKTAYEMRISDWSSDVCSSDLDAQRRRCSDETGDEAGGKRSRNADRAGPARARTPIHARRPIQRHGEPRRLRRCVFRSGDRKSVVSGKSVSVRVDLGGRRSIKKKQIKTYTRDHTKDAKQ